MAETRTQLKQRLQSEGKWNDYLALREKFAAEGLAPAGAREEALRQIEASQARPSEPPTPAPAVPDPPAAQEGTPDFSRQVPNAQATQWVAEHLADANARPQDAPSGLAWALL